MNDKKQIKEMAKILQLDNCMDVGITECRKFDDCNRCKATRLYNAGYRKQSGLTPCDVCKFNPPSSGDGKPCSMCPAQGKGGAE